MSCPSAVMSVWLMCLFVGPSACLPVPLFEFIYLPVCIFVCLPVCPPAHLLAHLSVCGPVCIPVCLSVRASFCLPVCVPACPLACWLLLLQALTCPCLPHRLSSAEALIPQAQQCLTSQQPCAATAQHRRCRRANSHPRATTQQQHCKWREQQC